MTTPFSVSIAAAVVFFLVAPSAHALGGPAATLAVVYGSSTAVCTIVAEHPVHHIQCWRDGHLLPPILPAVSFDAVAGGRDTLCGVRSGGSTLLCWNTFFDPKRIYIAASSPLTSLSIGDTQICALRNLTAVCWRGNINNIISSSRFSTISSGTRFSCGVLENSSSILCWGDEDDDIHTPRSIQSAFADYSMKTIHVGGRFACGISTAGVVICKGDNFNGQLNIPANNAHEYRALAVGADHSCAIRESNRTVICWGKSSSSFSFSGDVDEILASFSFESITAGLDFTCGLITTDLSVICWGPGWPDRYYISLPLRKSLPGPCVYSDCECNLYPQSQTLCSGKGHICRPCEDEDDVPTTVSPTNNTASSSSTAIEKGLLAFAIIGSVTGLAGTFSLIYRSFLGKKKVHNSVQPTITITATPISRSSTLKRQGSILMPRQRSGTSSTKHVDCVSSEFSFSDLSAATGAFSPENKIGSGSFGVVYKGKLPNGQEVAIKRSENGPKVRKFQEKETAFECELAFLSRVHHKHLVRLVGYCDERDERVLVYEYMKNGAIYDHLHNKGNTEKSLDSWKTRIKVSLDAARGIEYLHNYAVPPIIHRDIKSSNILLDESWTARVSDFGLSLMEDGDYEPSKAAGTVGYMDPEYYGMNVLTTKSDVYGFGVVLLELLTGKRAVFRSGENGGVPISIVAYAVPVIMAGDLGRVLDPRAGPAVAEAVELVGYTAMHCVHSEGKYRPSMSDVVANLERALGLCEESHGSVSGGGSISVDSD